MSSRSLFYKTVLLSGLLLAACGDNPQKMLASARDYMAKGDYNAATIQLKNALQKDPKLGEARLMFGQILFLSGDSQGAEKELRKAYEYGQPIDKVGLLLGRASIAVGKTKTLVTEFSAMNPSTPAGRAVVSTALGEAYASQEQFDQAEAAIKAALEADPASIDARVDLARLKVVRKDLPGAFATLDEVLKSAPNDFEAHNTRAEFYAMTGKLDEALADFAVAAKVRPLAVEPRLRRAQLLMAQHKLDEADKELAGLRKIAPRSMPAKLLEGSLALIRGKNEAARDAADQVLRAAPDFVPAIVLAGTAQLRLKDYTLAQDSFEKVVAKAPKAEGARRLLARAYVGGHEPSRALQVLQPLLEKDDPDSETLMVAGEAALQAGDHAKSAEYFSKVSTRAPKDGTVLTRLAMAHMAGGETERAIQDLESAVSVDSPGSEAQVALIMAELGRGNLAKAKTDAEAFIKKQPKQAEPYNLLAGVLMNQKDMAGARKNFELALAQQPTFLPAAINLARLDLADGKLPEARARFERIIEKDPKTVDAYIALAKLLVETKAKPEEVRALLDKAVAANPTVASPRLALIDWLQRNGDNKAALNVAQEVAAAFPSDPKVLVPVAQAQMRAGDSQQAVATLQKVVTLQGNSAATLVMLADAQMKSKDESSAEQSLRRALNLKADLYDAQERLIILYISHSRTNDALTVAHDIQRQRPKEGLGYVLEGDILGGAKKWAEATVAYAKGLDIAKQSSVAAKLHRAYLEAGKKADADALAQRWMGPAAKDTFFTAYMAERALAVKDYPESARLYKSIVEREPKNAMALNNLAWVAGQLKDPKAATYIQQALAVAPNAPALLDTQAQLLLDAGDPAQAVAVLRHALVVEPRAVEIRVNLARALIKGGNKADAKTELDTVLKTTEVNSAPRRDAEALLKSL